MFGLVFADIDWATIFTSAGTALGALVVAIGGAGKFLLDHLKMQREAQYKHEDSILSRVEIIADRFDKSVRDSRSEQQAITKTLLEIQKETVQAVGELSGRVGELGTAIQELRSEVGRKQDRDDSLREASRKQDEIRSDASRRQDESRSDASRKQDRDDRGAPRRQN